MSNLVRRDPTSWLRLPRDSFFGPFEQVFDQLINEFKGPSFFDRVKSNSGYPKMNISETGNDFDITVNVAGVAPEDLKIEVEDKILRISGKTHGQEENEDTCFYIRELTQRQFIREVRLPENIEGEPEATMKNGVLNLKWKLPEPQIEEKKIKTITIKQE